MAERLTVALAQVNLLVGDVQGNLDRMRREMQRGRAAGAQLTIFPELGLSGYPPEDLLLHRGMRRQVELALAQLRELSAAACEDGDCGGIVLGYPEYEGPASGSRIYNAAALIDNGELIASYRKHALPNYRVFDEKRYFTPGTAPCVVDYRGFRVGLLVCEDVWEEAPVRAAKAAGAELLLVINASPYEIHKQRERETVLRARIAEVRLPVAYVNLIGGQDELIFDGNSFAMDAAGGVTLRAPAFEEGLFVLEFVRTAGGIEPRPVAQPGLPVAVVPEQSDEASVYSALVLGVRDYVDKHGFPGVVMGLSGGVDSALTLAIAVDALGAQRVQAVMMPSPYTAAISREDALAQARRLGVSYSEISIEGMFAATLAALTEEFAGRKPDITEENIQARCRGLLLMAISNKTGRMLLTTGNKSEMAVGYATLYGDMAGGFAPIKDCSKLLVYRLSRYRNALEEHNGAAPVIPQRVLERAPSAELRPDQKDTDSLPPYEVLDPILEAFIEEDLSVDEIVARGFDRTIVGRVLDLVKRSEYKRRQAPPGVRVSRRAFGRDWRYPITNGYRR
jgi:NAD+ synthase (glutamine-hydrolysing)